MFYNSIQTTIKVRVLTAHLLAGGKFVIKPNKRQDALDVGATIGRFTIKKLSKFCPSPVISIGIPGISFGLSFPVVPTLVSIADKSTTILTQLGNEAMEAYRVNKHEGLRITLQNEDVPKVITHLLTDFYREHLCSWYYNNVDIKERGKKIGKEICRLVDTKEYTPLTPDNLITLLRTATQRCDYGKEPLNWADTSQQKMLLLFPLIREIIDKTISDYSLQGMIQLSARVDELEKKGTRFDTLEKKFDLLAKKVAAIISEKKTENHNSDDDLCNNDLGDTDLYDDNLGDTDLYDDDSDDDVKIIKNHNSDDDLCDPDLSGDDSDDDDSDDVYKQLSNHFS
jgi:hypothetical protein